MSIRKSQAILKCFIDLKLSVWFTPGSEKETMFWDTFFRSALPVKAFKTLNDVNDRKIPKINFSCTQACHVPNQMYKLLQRIL